MEVKLLDFSVGEYIDHKHSRAVASVQVGEKGYYVRGIYMQNSNEFIPDILGDPYELEDYYEEIKELVRNR